MQRLTPRKPAKVRGQKAKANPELEVVIRCWSLNRPPARRRRVQARPPR